VQAAAARPVRRLRIEFVMVSLFQLEARVVGSCW
jgi:hypothetical protein